MSRTNDPHSTEQSLPTSDPDVVYVGSRQSGQAIVEKRPGQERLTPDRSLALLLDYTGDEAFALDHYQEFKTDVVS